LPWKSLWFASNFSAISIMGENKLHFNEMMLRTKPTNLVGFVYKCSTSSQKNFLTFIISCVFFNSYALLADDHVNNVSYFPFMSIKKVILYLCVLYEIFLSCPSARPKNHVRFTGKCMLYSLCQLNSLYQVRF
jgi:hypothetical protein